MPVRTRSSCAARAVSRQLAGCFATSGPNAAPLIDDQRAGPSGGHGRWPAGEPRPSAGRTSRDGVRTLDTRGHRRLAPGYFSPRDRRERPPRSRPNSRATCSWKPSCRMQQHGRVVPAVVSGPAAGRFEQRGARVVVEQVDHGIEAHLEHGGVRPPFADLGSHGAREALAACDTEELIVCQRAAISDGN